MEECVVGLVCYLQTMTECALNWGIMITTVIGDVRF